MFNLSKSKHVNFLKIYKKVKGVYKKIPVVKERKKRNFVFKLIKYFNFAVLFVFLAFLIFIGVNLVNLKLIYQNANTGKDNLEYAVALVNNKEFDRCLEFAKLAENNFKNASLNIEKIQNDFFIKKINFIEVQINDFLYLSFIGEVLSRSVYQGAELGMVFNNIFGENGTFTALPTEKKEEILEFIYKSGPEINGIKANIDLAIINLNQISNSILTLPLKSKINNIKINLLQAQNLLSKAVPMSELIPGLMGYPEKSSFLILLQNSDELRPTGGFLGTYGILEAESGEILRYDTHDIYHMDMPVKDRIDVKPPAALKEYLGVEKWYMRDANWSPHWPIAADKIEWFYNEENKLLPPKDRINDFDGNFDGVIGITPKFVTDLLAITGPVYIENEEYNSNNFTDLLEYRVEKGYFELGVPSWHRKEVIGDIVEELKLLLLNKGFADLKEVVNVIGVSLDQKDIIAYFHDDGMQSVVKQQGWGGYLKETSGDYLMVIDANMAALKTDAVVNRSINYKVDQDINGLFADLRVSYANNGQFDWRTTRYRTYTRVYVPLNSRLVEASGYSEGKVETHNELGKTVFSAFISVEPGEIGALHFYYKLPPDINMLVKKGEYRLLTQKQPGNTVEQMRVDLSFINSIRSYSPTGFYVYKSLPQAISWDSDLTVDKEFEVIF
ncbi:hypothetical protein DRH27_00335 [Candidatus Falkowbacteria bacterium]|nr:MAG: hypothetical protein DRH27_00335 [Candidatus Falkowbacteria bacterium]